MTLLERTKAAREQQAHDAAVDAGQLREELADALYAQIPAKRIAQMAAQDRDRARKEVVAALELAISSLDAQSAPVGQRRIDVINSMADIVLGMGPIEGLLADDTVTEIMVNGASDVFYERDGKLSKSQTAFGDDAQIRAVIDRIIAPLGRRIDEQSPIVNARMAQGHRVNAVIPPIAVDGPILTIRKFRQQSYTLDELVEMGTMSRAVATLLTWAVRAKKNIAVSGGTGGGKTTLLNALSDEILPGERIITIEDSAELKFMRHPHVVRLEARPENAEGKGRVTIRELVANSLRMRPDRIIVGECRGAEAVDMLQAMNTGHDGSMTTLHANSVYEVVSRLVMMVRYGVDLPVDVIEEQIASAIGLVVQMDRFPNGNRRVTQIAELHIARLGSRDSDSTGAVIGAAGTVRLVPLLAWDLAEEEWAWRREPEWLGELERMEIASLEEVAKWRRLCSL